MEQDRQSQARRNAELEAVIDETQHRERYRAGRFVSETQKTSTTHQSSGELDGIENRAAR